MKDWRRRYLAATATLTDAQKKAMIPAYVHRNDGEVLIAEAASAKDSLVNALNELEILIDGDPGVITKINDFWALKAASRSYNDIVSYFFLLKNEAEFAGVSKDMMLIKFFNTMPGGEKIYESQKTVIKKLERERGNVASFAEV